MIRTVALVASLSLLPACPLLDVQAQVQEACVTYPGVHVDGVPDGAGPVETSFTLDHLDALQALASQGFTLRLVRGEIRATSGITDFSFIDTASVAVASGDPTSTLPTLDAFGCTGCGAGTGTLDLAAGTPADLAPYVATGSLVVSLELAGHPPVTDWTADVDVCVTGTLSSDVAP